MAGVVGTFCLLQGLHENASKLLDFKSTAIYPGWRTLRLEFGGKLFHEDILLKARRPKSLRNSRPLSLRLTAHRLA